MGDSAFVLNVDKALASLIWNTIKDCAEVKGLVSSEKQISFASPKKCEADNSKKLSVFLYSITENASARNEAANVDTSGKPCAQVFFTLHYIVTPCTGNEENDHLLLGKTMQTLANSPVLPNIRDDSAVVARLDSLSVAELSSLWSALGTPIKPCACYTVAPLGIKCSNELVVTTKPVSTPSTPQAATEVNRTLELYQVVHKTFVEQADGWKKRNLFQKQWVFQDFKKITDMTVEEMLSALNSLGDKLELHLSTSQYIKPLNILARFYEHQLKQLKSFERFSAKQKENLDMITQWIKDVKALIDALSSS
ncbi:MAG: DUF4255 domain-containing protein [Candidatus Bathyarchaeota archaeon]|nr:DUF4255 domain-containing protein [Candidatus Bathyarchaeota archaeon]